MARVIHRFPRQDAPQDSGVLVGQGHGRFLPTRTGLELYKPLAQPITAFGRRVDRRLGSLNQQERR